MSDQAQTPPSSYRKPQLYTCTLKCYLCLQTLTKTEHIEMKSGVKVNYVPCEKHPEAWTVLEWEPE